MLSKEEVEEKLEKGWIKSKLWFEVLSTQREVTENSLQAHIEKLKKTEGLFLVSEKTDEVKEVEKPLPNVEKGYSQTVETDLITKNVETLLLVVIFFAPSAVEVLHPEKLTLGANSVQVIMNSVADLIHRYAARGIGGTVISTKK